MFVLLSLLTVGLFSASDVSAASTDNQSSYQTAFLYFLPDYQPKDQDEAEVRGCAKLGYTVTRKDCAAPRILKDKCPVGNAYKECYCAGSPTCSGSTSSSNPYPSSTGASSTNCKNCTGNTLYTWTCSSSSCSAYTLSSCPSHGYCSQCCSGKYKLDSCASGYHVSGNSCEEDCNSSSYNWCPVHRSCHTNCCTDGTIQPCDPQCGGSGCCTDTCSSKGYLSSKPSGKDCSTTTVCGSTCYYNCTDPEPAHTHSYSCPDGYSSTNSWGSSAQTASKTCSCGATSGTCYKAPNCTPNPAATNCANGTESCSDGCGGTTTCCKAEPDCTLPTCTSINSKPDNSSYTTSSCTDCSGTKTVNTGWTCNSGYTKSGSSCIPIHTHSYSCPSGYSTVNSWGLCHSSVKQECSCGQKNTTSCYKNACTSSQKCYNGSCCTPTNSCSGYNLDSMSGCGGEGGNSAWKSNFYDECDTGCGKKYKCSTWGRCYNAGYTSSYCAEGWWESIVPCPYMSDSSPNCFGCGDRDQLYKCTGQIIRP